MPNPYGAVQDALRGTQETIRYIGSDMSAQRRRLAESKLLTSQMEYKKAAAESEIEFKGVEREFMKEKMKAFKAENEGKEVKFIDAFNMHTLGMPEEQKATMLAVLEKTQPGISNTMQRIDHMETAFKLMSERLTKKQEAGADQYTALGEAEKIKLGLTGPYQRSGKNKIEMVERPTEAKPKDFTPIQKVKMVDTLINQVTGNMLANSPKYKDKILEEFINPEQVNQNPPAILDAEDFKLYQKTQELAKKYVKTMSPEEAVIKAGKEVLNKREEAVQKRNPGETIIDYLKRTGK